jgi:hypothetical protein
MDKECSANAFWTWEKMPRIPGQANAHANMRARAGMSSPLANRDFRENDQFITNLIRSTVALLR